MEKPQLDPRVPEFITKNPDDYPQHITWRTLEESDERIVVLKINDSYRRREEKGVIKENEPFNSPHIQACIEDSWRSPRENLGRADLLLATLPLTSSMRAVVGVFEYSEVQNDMIIDEKGYYRSHFTGVQPVSGHRAAQFLGKLIVGINPRDTNPIRFFVNKPNKNQSTK